MTYNKAVKVLELMKDIPGLHKVIIESTVDNYYVTYEGIGMSYGWGGMRSINMHYSYIECEMDRYVDYGVSSQEPPVGRTQQQHDLIMSFNKRKRY